MRKNLLVFIFLSTIFLGCTRDDICPAGTATTPMLIITFKNANNSNASKKVIRLSVQTDYEDPVELFSQIETDSIALPLNINSDETKYKFTKTTVVNDTTNIVEISQIKFNYTRQELYVNRACGFKMQFNELSIIPDPSNESWIQNIEVIRDTINDESKAHIIMLH